jgi:adenylate kinase family enzyme
VRGEGTETLGQRLVERLSITQGMLDDNEKLRAEIDQLREAIRRLADQDATLSVQDGSVTVTLDATLTDAERKAIKTVIGGFGMWVAQNGLADDESLRLAVVTLRSLLERLHT